MTQALILGCSHAAGSEMEQGPNVVIDTATEWHWGYANSYPVQLAKLLGYKNVANHAIPGGSNDAMFRIFLQALNSSKPAVVIACWTGPERTEVWHNDEKSWQPMAAGKQRFHKCVPDPLALEGINTFPGVADESAYLEYQRQWVLFHSDGWWGRLNKIKNIVALNSVAKQHSVPVINVESFGSIHDHDFGTDVYRPILSEDFFHWAKKRNCQHTPGGHFFRDTHQQFAEYLYSQIDPKYQNIVDNHRC